MILYLFKLILILVFNICVNIYYINSECKCCCGNSKSGETGSGGGKSNSDILPGVGWLEKGDLGGAEQGQEQEQKEEGGEAEGEEASDDDEHVEEQEEKQEQKQEGEEQDQNNEEQGENHEEEELNNNKVEEEKEHEGNEEYSYQDCGEENGYGDNKNENSKTEPENAQQEEVIDVDKLKSVVFTLSEENGGIIKINDSDEQYSKADVDVGRIVNPLFKDYVWVYKITKELYNSINEDSKIVFTYKSENNQNDPEYIFCAVKVKETGYFLMVCTDGNTIYDEEKGYICGLFDAFATFEKDSKNDFLSEEFKMISCGRGIYNISSMFYRNTDLKKIIFLEGFNTGNVADMSFMFANCSSLTNLNLSKFNTGKVVNIEYMFGGCNNLEELDLSSFDEANSLEELNEMFKGCPIEIEVLTSNNEIKQEMNDRINRLIKIKEQEQEQQNQEQNNENQ